MAARQQWTRLHNRWATSALGGQLPVEWPLSRVELTRPFAPQMSALTQSGHCRVTHQRPRQGQYNGNFGETYTLPIRAYSCPRDTGRLMSWRPQGTSASPSPCALSHQQHRQMPCRCMHFGGKQFTLRRTLRRTASGHFAAILKGEKPADPHSNFV